MDAEQDDENLRLAAELGQALLRENNALKARVEDLQRREREERVEAASVREEVRLGRELVAAAQAEAAQAAGALAAEKERARKREEALQAEVEARTERVAALEAAAELAQGRESELRIEIGEWRQRVARGDDAVAQAQAEAETARATARTASERAARLVKQVADLELALAQSPKTPVVAAALRLDADAPPTRVPSGVRVSMSDVRSHGRFETVKVESTGHDWEQTVRRKPQHAEDLRRLLLRECDDVGVPRLVAGDEAAFLDAVLAKSALCDAEALEAYLTLSFVEFEEFVEVRLERGASAPVADDEDDVAKAAARLVVVEAQADALAAEIAAATPQRARNQRDELEVLQVEAAALGSWLDADPIARAIDTFKDLREQVKQVREQVLSALASSEGKNRSGLLALRLGRLRVSCRTRAAALVKATDALLSDLQGLYLARLDEIEKERRAALAALDRVVAAILVENSTGFLEDADRDAVETLRAALASRLERLNIGQRVRSAEDMREVLTVVVAQEQAMAMRGESLSPFCALAFNRFLGVLRGA